MGKHEDQIPVRFNMGPKPKALINRKALFVINLNYKTIEYDLEQYF